MPFSGLFALLQVFLLRTGETEVFEAGVAGVFGAFELLCAWGAGGWGVLGHFGCCGLVGWLVGWVCAVGVVCFGLKIGFGYERLGMGDGGFFIGGGGIRGT